MTPFYGLIARRPVTLLHVYGVLLALEVLILWKFSIITCVFFWADLLKILPQRGRIENHITTVT